MSVALGGREIWAFSVPVGNVAGLLLVLRVVSSTTSGVGIASQEMDRGRLMGVPTVAWDEPARRKFVRRV